MQEENLASTAAEAALRLPSGSLRWDTNGGAKRQRCFVSAGAGQF